MPFSFANLYLITLVKISYIVSANLSFNSY